MYSFWIESHLMIGEARHRLSVVGTLLTEGNIGERSIENLFNMCD
jgi:hypothetical protein